MIRSSAVLINNNCSYTHADRGAGEHESDAGGWPAAMVRARAGRGRDDVAGEHRLRVRARGRRLRGDPAGRGGVYSSLYATSVDHVAESVGAGGARSAREESDAKRWARPINRI